MAKSTVIVKNKATINSTVSFIRKGLEVLGKVIEIRENTVMVEILDDNIRQQLDLANSLTVVNHKKYTIISNGGI